MTATLTTQQARSIVVADPAFCNMVGDALFDCETPREFHDVCFQCAAELYRTDWLSGVCYDAGGLATPDEIVKQKTREAVSQLRACGVLPSGWLAWLAAIALRHAVQAFLETLITDWLRQ